MTALALGSEVNRSSRFDRKHYFYADLPQGYQITQQRSPIGKGGHLRYINNIGQKVPYEKEAKIVQVQLEQDSGKSIHDLEGGKSYIDLNRAGMALMEIVTEPDFNSSSEAVAFIRELQLVLETIGTCDCRMEEGSLRVDANISIHRQDDPLGTRAEVKNLNSFKALKQAIESEIKRQIAIKSAGGEIVNETRSFDVDTGETVAMRDKERLQDYRFMPEPNLPPVIIYNNTTVPESGDATSLINIDELRDSMPRLPEDNRVELLELGLNMEQTLALVYNADLRSYFHAVLCLTRAQPSFTAYNLLYYLYGELNKRELEASQCYLVEPGHFAELLDLKIDGQINNLIGTKILKMLLDGTTTCPRDLVISNNWGQISDPTVLRGHLDQIIKKQPKTVRQYKNGKKRALTAMINQVQALT
ncbi:unnamed protein product, partial [Owenia fusiformis]